MLFLEYIFCARHKAARKRDGEGRYRRGARKREEWPQLCTAPAANLLRRALSPNVTMKNAARARFLSPLSSTRVDIFKLPNGYSRRNCVAAFTAAPRWGSFVFSISAITRFWRAVTFELDESHVYFKVKALKNFVSNIRLRTRYRIVCEIEFISACARARVLGRM